MPMLDEVRYARSGEVAIAYAIYGGGPRDLVFAHGGPGNIEIEREIAFMRAFQDRCGEFARFIVFDKRGTGLSDRLREPAPLETRMDDLRAVLDAAGSERAVLFGSAEAGSMCLLFAATYPERTLGLVLCNPVVRGTSAPDFPWAPTPDEFRQELEDTVVGAPMPQRRKWSSSSRRRMRTTRTSLRRGVATYGLREVRARLRRCCA